MDAGSSLPPNLSFNRMYAGLAKRLDNHLFGVSTGEAAVQAERSIMAHDSRADASDTASFDAMFPGLRERLGR
jgi:hypothetical protein